MVAELTRAGSLLLTALLLAAPALAQEEEAAPPRIRYTVNEGWRYAPGPLDGAAAPEFADGAWARVDLPHTWNAEDAFDDAEGYRRGIGWYRRRLRLSPALQGKRLFLYFEAANQVADVYVNGRHAGQHIGGYTAFAFDVTDLVRFDAPNVVAVRVNNEHDPDIPPLDADFTFYGGLYRDVWLVATEPLHLAVTEHAAPGVYIDTPEVSDTAATVRIRSVVVNHADAPRQVRVVHRIANAQGREVAVLETGAEILPDTAARLEQSGNMPSAPRLWSPDDPYLYRVSTEVYAGDSLVDRVENPLGFRWFEATGEGFFLNGEPLFLAGTNRHQDYPGYGNALPDRFHERDLRIIDEDGFNFLRLAHYPQDPRVLEVADRRGLLLWEEVPVVNTITQSEAFRENSERMLVEMIHQHYNHPSVAMWGYMNEIMLRPRNPLPEGYYEDVLDLAEHLEAVADSLDPHRLTATAQSFHEIYNGKGVSDVPDVLGMNLYFGWYYEELESLGAFLDTLHAQHPDRPLMISEYGAGSDERVHTMEPQAFDFSTEYQQRFHEADFRQITERPYLVGSAVWNQFDFGSALRQDTKNAINQKGLYFFDRTPKEVAFYYRAKLSGEPVLRIATRGWTRRAGSRPKDRRQPVVIYTNGGEVELLLNGDQVGTQPVENATARFQVTLQPGENTLRARTTRGGTTVEDEATIRYADRTSFFEDATSEETVMAVNAGAHYSFVDETGTVWEADRAYEPGSWGYLGGAARRTHHRILSTPDDPLYQAARDSVQAYRFDVPDGAYEVVLGFVEREHGGAGQRVFSAYVNGQPVVEGLDLAGQHGRFRALTRKARVHAGGGGGLVIRFEAEAGAPTISSLLVRRLF